MRACVRHASFPAPGEGGCPQGQLYEEATGRDICGSGSYLLCPSGGQGTEEFPLWHNAIGSTLGVLGHEFDPWPSTGPQLWLRSQLWLGSDLWPWTPYAAGWPKVGKKKSHKLKLVSGRHTPQSGSLWCCLHCWQSKKDLNPHVRGSRRPPGCLGTVPLSTSCGVEEVWDQGSEAPVPGPQYLHF